MSKDKSKKNVPDEQIKPELPTEVAAELPAAPTPEELAEARETEKAECEAKCKEYDVKIQEVNLRIAELRREKDRLVGEQDELRTRIHELRPTPAEELQRHIRVQQQARAARTEAISSAAKAIAAAGVNPGAAVSPLDAAMKNRPRQKPNGAR